MKTLLLLPLLLNPLSHAFTVSNSGTEVTFSYSMEFRSLYQKTDRKLNPKHLAENHAFHLDGLFHSPEYAKAIAGYDVNLIQGFAGAKMPEIKNGG